MVVIFYLFINGYGCQLIYTYQDFNHHFKYFIAYSKKITMLIFLMQLFAFYLTLVKARIHSLVVFVAWSKLQLHLTLWYTYVFEKKNLMFLNYFDVLMLRMI
jgi:hypothetical protein